MLVSCFLAFLTISAASPSEYWAMATPAVRRARSLQGLEAAGGRTLSKAEESKVWCGRERYNGAAGPMWYANPYTAGCSKASMPLTYVFDGHVHTAAKGELIKMTCDNWQCPVPKVVDCYRDRSACAADEWCMVITHEKWGAWAMGKDGHTPNFDQCGQAYYEQIEAIASQGNVNNITVDALKATRDAICGSATVGVANGIQLHGLSEDALWKPSHGRCVKYRHEGESCIPTLSTQGRFANAFVRRAQEPGKSYPNGGTMERPLACGPDLVCTGPSFDVLPSTCVKARPRDVCYSGPWWDSSRCPRTSMKRSGMTRDWAIESLQTAFLLFPGEVASPMTCKYWTGPFAIYTEEVRNVTYNIFEALWPKHLVGEIPSMKQLYHHMWHQTDLNLAALKPEVCEAGAEVEGNISKALAMAGSWSHRPNLLWSLIHFVMHNQPSPMSQQAVAASEARKILEEVLKQRVFKSIFSPQTDGFMMFHDNIMMIS